MIIIKLLILHTNQLKFDDILFVNKIYDMDR